MDIRRRGKSKSALRVSAIRRGDAEEMPERERIDGDMMFKDFIKMYMQDRIEERQQIAELREEVRNIWGGTQRLIRKETEGQMGDTEEGADQLDEQIWGSDEEEENEADENEVGTNEEKENGGKEDGNKELTTKESAATDKDESSDPNGEFKDDKNQINEEDPEYDHDQIDPYHSNQPELLEPEPMILPDDLQLHDNEKGNKKNQQQENDDPDGEKGDATEEDDSNNSENSNKPDAHETEEDDTDNQKKTAQFDDAMDPVAKEDVEKNEQSTLDQTSAQDAQAQPVDVDNNTNESADKVHANQAKNRISCKDKSVMQQGEDKDCKEEDKAFEMSEDFDSKIHGAHKNQNEESQDEYHSDAESDYRIIKGYDDRMKGIT